MVSSAPFKRKEFISVTVLNRGSTVCVCVCTEREREEQLCCLLWHSAEYFEGHSGGPAIDPSHYCLPSLAKDASFMLRRNCSPRVGQVKHYRII